MDRLINRRWGPGRSAARSLAWFAGALAWIAAGAIAAVLAVFFAATLVVIVLMASVLIAFTGAALRARRTVRATTPADPSLIEARNIGGHSWVAYGWDGQRQAH